MFAQTRNDARELHPPGLFVGIGKTQAAQDHVAFVGQSAFTVPDGFKGRVESAPARGAFGPAGVPLDAERRRTESEGRALIVESVDGNLHGIVAVDVLARRHVGPDALGLVVESKKDDMQFGAVITDIDLGALAGGVAVVGFALNEIFYLCHGPGQLGGGFHAGEIFQRRYAADFRNDQIVLRECGPGPKQHQRQQQTRKKYPCKATNFFRQNHNLETPFRSLATPGGAGL